MVRVRGRLPTRILSLQAQKLAERAETKGRQTRKALVGFDPGSAGGLELE